MIWQYKRVAVIGGSGFLGKALVKKLLQLKCQEVISFARSQQADLAELGATVIRGDILNCELLTEALKGVDIVFHLAAKAGIEGSKRRYRQINVVGTENVIEACRKNSIKRLLFTSSPSVAYNGSEDICGINEYYPLPNYYLSYYSETKAEAEQIVLAANSSKLITSAIRPHLLWGPGDAHLLPRVIKLAKQQKLKIIGDGKNVVDITHIDNAVNAHILAAEELFGEQKNAGSTYFISDDNPVELWPWINNLLQTCGLTKVEQKVSYSKIYRYATFLEIVNRLIPFYSYLPMSRFSVSQLAHSHHFDISAAKRDFNYSVDGFNSKIAFENCCDWVTENLL